MARGCGMGRPGSAPPRCPRAFAGGPFMTPTLEQFTQALITSRLMSAEELGRVLERLPAERRPRTAEELGKLLVHQGL